MEEDRPVSQRTRIIFAFVGLATCVAGVWCAESLLGRMHAGPQLRRYHIGALLYVTDPAITRRTVEIPPPQPLIDSDLQRRLDKAGASSGDVQISLTWNNRNDLDLQCTDPFGERIDGYNQASRSGGVLDVDMNPTDEGSMTQEAWAKSNTWAGVRRTHRTSYSDTAPVENLIWANNAPQGHYKVFVHQFCNKERVDRTPFWIVVRVHGETQRIAGSVGREDFAEQLIDPKLVYEFDVGPTKPVPPPEPAKAVAPPPTAQTRVETTVAYSLAHLDFALLTAGLWGALAGLLPMGLLVAQRIYLRQNAVQGSDDAVVGIGGPATGFMAAITAQLVLAVTAFIFAPGAVQILIVLSWTLFGGMFGGVLGLYTPNVGRIPGLIAGAASACVGAVAFLFLAAANLDLAGRVLCAALIGGTIGALIALPERERIEVPEPPPPQERPRFEVQPPFVVHGTRTRKVGGLRQTDNPSDR